MYLWLLCLLLARTNALPLRSNSEAMVLRSPVGLEGFSIVEGDILKPDFEDDGRNAIMVQRYLWKNGRIPYAWGDNFNEKEKNQILKAMEEIESNTCIKFVERTNERTYANLEKNGKGCYSAVAKLFAHKGGPQPVNLQPPGCLSVGLIQHELLHMIGLYHEQSRPDRDNYVTIHWENIKKSDRVNFSRGKPHIFTTFGIPYDYNSIMHYGTTDFSKNGQPTITAKGDPDKKIGQREKPTPGDYEKVIKMYNCDMKKSTEAPA